MAEIKRVRVILNCHPGEKAAKRYGEDVLVPALQERGYSVATIPMPSAWEVDGRMLKYWEAFSYPGELEKRTAEERRIALGDSEALTLTVHDGPLADRTYGFVQKQPEMVAIEIGARYHSVVDPERSEARTRASCCIDPRNICYVTEESDPESSIMRELGDPGLKEQVIDLIEGVSRQSCLERKDIYPS